MKYPLPEEIGEPGLFVGRKKEMAMFDEWIKGIPKKLSKSHAIFSRKKSGKTALIERIFNKLWSENGEVIPFFINIPDTNVWLPNFAIDYYRIFVSQYISFLERDEKIVREPLTLKQIKKYGQKHSFEPLIHNVESLLEDKQAGLYDSMWKTAYTAPHRFAGYFNKRILVMIDEFQHLSKYIYKDSDCKSSLIESLPGSYHVVSESKIAPMLVTGSYTSWLNEIIHKYLKAGRLSKYFMSPYLTSDEGLEAVKTYSKFFNKKVSPITAQLINKLCYSDPFFISCVIKSRYENNDLTIEDNVINTVHYEIASKRSDMSSTWREYIDGTLNGINNTNAKKILLHMSQKPDRIWSPKELQKELALEINENHIYEILEKLEKSNLIEEGDADMEYQGLKDGTLFLVLRSRYGKEIEEFEPDIRIDFAKQLKDLQKENLSLSGKFNTLKGEVAEDQLAKAFRTKKRFSLSFFFKGVTDKKRLNIVDVRTHLIIQRDDGKNMEFDIKAESSCGRVVLVEVKKWKKKVSVNVVKDFIEKVEIYSKQNFDKKVLAAFYSENGFSKPAKQLCEDRGVSFNTAKGKWGRL